MGLIAAVELVADKGTKRAFNDNRIGAYCQHACEDSGLIVRALSGNTITLCPPLIITEKQVDEMIGKLGMAIDATFDHVTSNQLEVA